MCLSNRELEDLVDALPQADRVRLLAYLKPLVESPGSPPSQDSIDEAWRRFREIGRKLAATSVPGAPSVTETLTQSRR
jgi:hypothetical protein